MKKGDTMSTPHARGSTRVEVGVLARCSVYPACAGIHPVSREFQSEFISVPRMRGDPPKCYAEAPAVLVSTPHARGSTPEVPTTVITHKVYPACAGIHRYCRRVRKRGQSLPRMRGDPPLCRWVPAFQGQSTPHARGSTRRECRCLGVLLVYPACAGIHPSQYLSFALRKRLPRMRGDPPLKGEWNHG